MVLGHTNCGAVKAASEILHNHEKAEADIEYLVKELALAVEIGDEEGDDHLDRAVRAQIFHVVERLKRLPILNTAVERGELKIIGTGYDLDSGAVELVIE